MDRFEQHKDICKKLNQTYIEKNTDYGNSFGDTFSKLGIISAITRISDKYNRICSLATKSEQERKVKDESIRDTLLDLANYCIMTIIEMDLQEYEKSESECKCDDCNADIEAKSCPPKKRSTPSSINTKNAISKEIQTEIKEMLK